MIFKFSVCFKLTKSVWPFIYFWKPFCIFIGVISINSAFFYDERNASKNFKGIHAIEGKRRKLFDDKKKCGNHSLGRSDVFSLLHNLKFKSCGTDMAKCTLNL
jgi:hypothetical protein